MGRPRIIETQQILDAARQVFLEKGAAASTAQVAVRAGVSQASIFKRFKTKQELFVAAMVAERDRQDWVGTLRRRTSEAGLQEALFEMGMRAITFLRPVVPLLLMSWSNRGEFGFHRGEDRRGADIAAIFAEQMKAGRLRRLDPELVARAFVGAMQSYVLMSLVGPKKFWTELEPEVYVRGIVDLLWNGIAPRPPAKSAKSEKS